MSLKKNTRKEERPELTIVIPVFNEIGNVESLTSEIERALAGSLRFEIVFVNDSSDDGTLEALKVLKSQKSYLRVFTHKKRCGQSAAILTGVRVAKASLVATLDGDGQNNPKDLTKLYDVYVNSSEKDNKLMICGYRSKRQDNFIKVLSSKVANSIRSKLLRDGTIDTGCGIKLFRAQDFLDLPIFDHMHRFLPALILRDGGRIISTEVVHRSRGHGNSKYGLFDRLWVGIIDICGVMWLKRRKINVEVDELE